MQGAGRTLACKVIVLGSLGEKSYLLFKLLKGFHFRDYIEEYYKGYQGVY